MTLRTRLSAFFLAALALVLAGFSICLYLLGRSELYGQAMERLWAGLTTLTAVVEEETDGLDWEPQAHHLSLGRDTGPDQIRWEVRDGQGQLVDRSPSLGDETLLPADYVVESLSQAEGCLEVYRDGRPWQLVWRRFQRPRPVGAGPARPPTPGGRRPQTLVVTAGVNRQPWVSALQRLTLTLAGLSACLWLAAALVGRVMVGRALTPLARMVRAARGMGAAHLEERLPV